uniref:Uncharacterized protein n=1 Tax=Pseudomonas syringae pv. actinidiae TaxID=103796 RepID=A0A2P0QH07_PSESF|nr:hypothetical protein [Pseudomonas syringae]ARO44789.1 hypothetical protein [Pseudomonas syringae pv. actinidiae]
MNIVWWVLRPFYLMGLVPVIPVALIACFDYRRNPEVAGMLIVAGLLYIALGYFMFAVAPRMLKRRLERQIDAYKHTGFTPQYEAFSVAYNRYVGFDPEARKALYLDMTTGGVVVDFDQIDHWELSPGTGPHPLLKLVTRLPNLREIGVRINRPGAWMSDMHTLFG